MKKYIHIVRDSLYIVERLKEIDSSYFVLLNLVKGKFEIHSLGQKNGTFCFTCPYDSLDERTVEYAKKTRAVNALELIAQMDQENDSLKKKNFKEAVNKIGEALS